MECLAQMTNHLLPPNMSVLDMVLESKEFQYAWFIKLVEMQGLEAANKFTDILRQVPALTTNQQSGAVQYIILYLPFDQCNKVICAQVQDTLRRRRTDSKAHKYYFGDMLFSIFSRPSFY